MKQVDWYDDTVKGSMEIMKYFGFLHRIGLHETIDLHLRFIDLNSSSLALVTALRINVQMHRAGMLSEWRYARDRIHDELISRGENADTILHGLYSKDWK